MWIEISLDDDAKELVVELKTTTDTGWTQLESSSSISLVALLKAARKALEDEEGGGFQVVGQCSRQGRAPSEHSVDRHHRRRSRSRRPLISRNPRPMDITEKLCRIADASRRDDGTDIPLGEQCREAAAEIERLRKIIADQAMQ